MSLKAKRKVTLEPVIIKDDQASHSQKPPITLPISSKTTLDDYEEKESLGSGSQSTVSRVVKKDTGENFALKKIRYRPENPKDLQKLIDDIFCLNILRHPNIVRVYTAFYVEERINILMWYNDGLSLSDYLRYQTKMSEQALGRLVWGVLQGLSYLRRNCYLHRDLKPSNILISKNIEVKIADFGMARHLAESTELAQTYIGTMFYMAPERINDKAYSFKSDIWSLGMITYQCACGRFPYPGDMESLTFWDLKAYLQKDINVKIPDGFSPECQDFVSACLRVDPNGRAAVEELVKHPWVMRFEDEGTNTALMEWVQKNEKIRESEHRSLLSLSAAGITAGPR